MSKLIDKEQIAQLNEQLVDIDFVGLMTEICDWQSEEMCDCVYSTLDTVQQLILEYCEWGD